MLKSSKGAGYKALARQTKTITCSPKNIVCSYVVVDVRSRMFKYVREMSKIRSTKEKVKCVFGLLLEGMVSEIKKVCDEAQDKMVKEVSIIGGHVQYVLCSPERCPYRERLKIAERKFEKAKAKERMTKALNKCKKHILDVSVMIECHDAFVGYLISHIEEACLMYNNKQTKTVRATVMPDDKDSYESDRLCARMSRQDGEGKGVVLSEDYDCIFLFGAEKMIKKITKHVVQYVTIHDAMIVCGCNDRKSLIYKCFLMGTDYNLGLKGIGPKKAVSTKNEHLTVLAEKCMKQQCIDMREIMKFFM